jgi:hypothetical protein
VPSFEIVFSLSPALQKAADSLIKAMEGFNASLAKSLPAWNTSFQAQLALLRRQPLVAAAKPAKRLGGGKRKTPVTTAKKHTKPAVRAKVTNRWRTADRKEKLPGLWRRGVMSDDIKRAFDADGAPPVLSERHLGIWASGLGAKRPPGFPKSGRGCDVWRATHQVVPPASVSRAVASKARIVASKPETLRDPAPERIAEPATAPDPAKTALPVEPAAPRSPSLAQLASSTEPYTPRAPAAKLPIDPRVGAMSVAARIGADDAAAQMDCPVIWADALEWAIRHRPNGFDRPTSLKDVQAIRAHHELPPYRLIRPRQDHREPLPRTDLIERETAPSPSPRAASGHAARAAA